MRNTRDTSLLAAAMITTMGAGRRVACTVTSADPNPYRPRPPKRSTALQREIAAHNEAVEARKAEKKARKAKKETP